MSSNSIWCLIRMPFIGSKELRLEELNLILLYLIQIVISFFPIGMFIFFQYLYKIIDPYYTRTSTVINIMGIEGTSSDVKFLMHHRIQLCYIKIFFNLFFS